MRFQRQAVVKDRPDGYVEEYLVAAEDEHHLDEHDGRWKTYVGRPEGDRDRMDAMTELGNGLHDAGHDEDALSVREAELAMLRRVGDSGVNILVVQTNLANTYQHLGRNEEALRIRREVYSGRLKLSGKEAEGTLRAANNYADCLVHLQRFEEAKALMRKTVPVARRVLGENDKNLPEIRWTYAQSLYKDPAATLDDLREAVTTLEDIEQTVRRVFGGAHPLTSEIEDEVRDAQAALRAREASSPSPSESS